MTETVLAIVALVISVVFIITTLNWVGPEAGLGVMTPRRSGIVYIALNAAFATAVATLVWLLRHFLK